MKYLILLLLLASCGHDRECFESYEYQWNGHQYKEVVKINCEED